MTARAVVVTITTPAGPRSHVCDAADQGRTLATLLAQASVEWPGQGFPAQVETQRC